MKPSEEFPHYFRDVSHLKTIDVYRIIDLFGVTNPCDQHALKKILAGGKRGAKDTIKDTKEAIVTLRRKLEMLEEDVALAQEQYADAAIAHFRQTQSEAILNVMGGDAPQLSPVPATIQRVEIGGEMRGVSLWLENPGHQPVESHVLVQVKTQGVAQQHVRAANAVGWSNRMGDGLSVSHYRIVK